jgi:hypothetical protein
MEKDATNTGPGAETPATDRGPATTGAVPGPTLGAAVDVESNHPEPPTTSTDDFPEGGRQAWTVLFGTWCVLFCTYGLGNSIGVFQTYYVNEALKEYSSSTISWILSFMQWLLNFMPIVVCSPSPPSSNTSDFLSGASPLTSTARVGSSSAVRSRTCLA